MNHILLDTHTFIWGLANSTELSATARNILDSPGIEKHLSLASVWEMAIKSGMGKLRLPGGLKCCLGLASQSGLQLDQIELDAILGVESLPEHHRDPFDRLLASHCLMNSLPLLSRDTVFDQYGVQRLW